MRLISGLKENRSSRLMKRAEYMGMNMFMSIK